MEGIRLRRIVRKSTLPHQEAWPEESRQRIAHLMTSSDRCHAGILEYLAIGAGRKDNMDHVGG